MAAEGAALADTADRVGHSLCWALGAVHGQGFPEKAGCVGCRCPAVAIAAWASFVQPASKHQFMAG